MEHTFNKIPGAVCCLDDILITGNNNQEHLQRLDLALKRLRDWGLKIKKETCLFLKDSLQYIKLSNFFAYHGRKSSLNKMTFLMSRTLIYTTSSDLVITIFRSLFARYGLFRAYAQTMKPLLLLIHFNTHI